MRQFSCVVVGLGQIGQGYDYERTDDSHILTHATAFTHHKGYQLMAAVDPDEDQRERFERKFGRPAYPDVQGVMSYHQPEVFSIAVPAADHLRIFLEIMPFRPRAILCEKPIATCVADARTMVAVAEENECALLVNYGRRFEPGVLSLKRAIQSGAAGEICKGTVWYSKGLLNNGSHFIDLLRFLWGEVTHIQVIDKGRMWHGEDPEPDLCLHFGQTPVYFLAGRGECFWIGQMALITTKGMIRYGEGGPVIEIEESGADPLYPGYNTLGQGRQTILVDSRRSQWHVVEALHRHLTDNARLNSDGRSAMETLAVVENASELLWGRPS